MEIGEAPHEAAEREVLEELGIRATPARLLVVHHSQATDLVPSKVQFVFMASMIVPSGADLVMQPEEVHSVRWVEAEEAPDRHVGSGSYLRAALAAHRDGNTAYLTESAAQSSGRSVSQ